MKVMKFISNPIPLLGWRVRIGGGLVNALIGKRARWRPPGGRFAAFVLQIEDWK